MARRWPPWTAAAALLAHGAIIYAPLLAASVSNSPLTAALGRLRLATALGAAAGVVWLAVVVHLAASAAVRHAFILSARAAVALLGVTAVVASVVLARAAEGASAFDLLAGSFVAATPAAVAVGNMLWMRRASERIAFVAEELRLVVSLLRGRRDVYLATAVLAAAQCAYLLLFARALAPVLALGSFSAVAAVVACMLSFRWVTGFFKHCVTCIVAAVLTARVAEAAAVATASPAMAARVRALTDDGRDDVDGDAAPLAAPATTFIDTAAAAAGGGGMAPKPTHGAGAGASGADVEIVLNATPSGAAGGGGGRGGAGRRAGDGDAVEAAVAAVEGDAIGAPGGDNGSTNGGGAAGRLPVVPPTLAPMAHVSAWAQLARCLTVDAGTIAMGALLGSVAPLVWPLRRATRAALQPARRRGTVVAALGGACARRALPLQESYLRSAHKYAYVLVAQRRQAWLPAAHATWHLFARNGVDAIIDDDVTDRMLLFGGYVGGGFLCLLLGVTVSMPSAAAWVATAAVTFAIGFVGMTLPLTVLEASVSTLLVTYAELPEAVAVLHPVIAHRFSRLSEVHAMTQRSAGVAVITDPSSYDDA